MKDPIRSELIRLPAGGGCPGGYFPVSTPCASGDHTICEMPCAAQTGLESSGPLAAFAQAAAPHAGCYGYAQGGARVTNPVGPGNAALLALGDSSGALGQLTKPVVEQIGRHLAAVGGSFAADDLVTVMAGGELSMSNAELSSSPSSAAPGVFDA